MRLSWKRTAGRVIALLMTMSVFAGCSKSEQENVIQATRVETEAASRGTLEITGTYIGTLSPHNSVDVTPLVSGTVTRVNVKVGDKVQEGDVLCTFDDTAAELQLKSARDAVESAKAGKQAADGKHAVVRTVLIEIGLHEKQNRTHADQCACGDAGKTIEAPGVRKGPGKAVRKIHALFLVLPDKAKEQHSGSQNIENQNDVKSAFFCKAKLVKGHLQLQPAQKDAESAGAGDVTEKLQRFFAAAKLLQFRIHEEVPPFFDF